MRHLTAVVFGFGAATLAFAGTAHAAALRLSPAAGSFVLGSTFDVSVILNTNGVAVNTIEAEIKFPPKQLQLANPSLGTSLVQIWASPPTFSNQEGRIYFVGGIPSPGITTSEGIAQSFTFRVIAPGEAKISFGENTSILANDGLGTDLLKQTSPAFFKLILPPAQGPEIFSPTHPEQGKWYRDPNPIFKWDSAPGSEGFSYAIDHSPTTVPDTKVDGFDAQATFSDLESGIWYFHVREKAGGSWGGASHYFAQIDTQPPAAFTVNASPGETTSSRSPILRFFTTDSLSGFDHFELKAVPLRSGPSDTTFFFEATSPYQLSGLASGRHEVIVRAFDRAGNFRDESVTLHIVSSLFSFVSPEGVDLLFVFIPWGIAIPILVLLAVILAILVMRTWRRHGHHLRRAVVEDFSRLRLRRAPRRV